VDAAKAGQSADELALRAELADLEKMNEMRKRVDSIVRDRATAEALKPWYRYLCKRPTFSDHYLPTFNRPNVTLVDTKGAGVDAINERGLLFDGVEYPVDCIVFATGFEGGTNISRRVGFDIFGHNGEALTAKWSNGFRSLHGMICHGFPNFFFTGVNQNALSFALTYSLDEQAEHIVAIIERATADGWIRSQPTAESERAWNDVIRQTSVATRQFYEQCTPGYFNNEGQTDRAGAASYDTYGGNPLEFYRMTREWRSGSMEGLQIEVPPRSDAQTTRS
jgi:cation diffusion facilitator CzcD-associated flavoprotein CzcO